LHILMISDVFFPRINGVSTSIESFRRELLAQGHRVTLLCPEYPDSQPGAGTIHLAERDIRRVPSWRAPLDPEDRLMRWGKLLRHLPALATEGIDIVHVHTPFVAHYAGRRIARRLGVPLVESYHTFFEEYADKYVPLLPSAWLRSLARAGSRSQGNSVDRLVVPSVPMKAALATYGVTTPMTVIPTGIAIAPLAPVEATAAFRHRHDISNDAPLLLYVGRVAREKNIDLLIDMLPDVLERHPETMLVIAGEGPARSALERRVETMGLTASVRFIGYLCRETELPAAYRAADLFVFASTSETQGIVLLEALAQETPVVAISRMGTRDVLDEDGGCRIVPEDPAAFAARVSQLLEDDAERDELRAAARRYARSWSAVSMAERLAELYADVAGT